MHLNSRNILLENAYIQVTIYREHDLCLSPRYSLSDLALSVLNCYVNMPRKV